MNLAATVEIFAYGTSEGVTKAWDSRGRKESALPPQPRLPDEGQFAAVQTDDGGIYPDLHPEKQRTHIMLAKDLGIPPERIVSGGWLKDGVYDGSERSDAGRWGEQARAKLAVSGKRGLHGTSVVLAEIKVGDPVTWDGGTSRGVVVERKGKRVTIQIQDWRGGAGYRNGYRLERDESSVHKI